MMDISGHFIKKPILAVVLNLVILILGIKALFSLPITQYPKSEDVVIAINTTFPGADAATMAGFITQPIEAAISQTDGIDYLKSTSNVGISSVIVKLKLNYDSGKALTEISAKIGSIQDRLPQSSQKPIISVSGSETLDAMYIGFNSEILNSNQITDYIARVIQPRIQGVTGVKIAEIIGGKNFALRAWINPVKLAAYNVTAAELANMLRANDFVSGIGSTKGQMVQVNLTTDTSIHELSEFKNLIIKSYNGVNVKLQDVATVTLGSEEYDNIAALNGKRAVFLGIKLNPTSNMLEVLTNVKLLMPEIKASLPEGLSADITFDTSKFVEDSIYEVFVTIVEALLVVSFVVFIFIGSWREALIPIIAIPLSLVGTLFVIYYLGYTLNLLTLLAFVLAIGLVVDDAIIVVENISRKISNGSSPAMAAEMAGQELFGPIIAMTVVLIAVYLPLGFQHNLTGTLFTEFAFTLAGAVTVSAVVAITLTPVISAHILTNQTNIDGSGHASLKTLVDRFTERLRDQYGLLLQEALIYPWALVMFGMLFIPSIYWMYAHSPQTLAPQEDQSIILAIPSTAPNASTEQKLIYDNEIYKIMEKERTIKNVFQFELGTSISGAVLVSPDDRVETANLIQGRMSKAFQEIAGASIAVYQLPSLPGSSGLPIQVVLQTTDSIEQLDKVSRAIVEIARNSGKFIYIESDLKLDNPQAAIVVDKEKAAQMGLKMSDIGNALGSLLGGGYNHYFSLDGRSYKVIPQVAQKYRLNPEDILNEYIVLPKGNVFQLKTIASIDRAVGPRSINRFQQQNSATIGAVSALGISEGDAIDYLKTLVRDEAPKTFGIDFSGASRQYVKESGDFILLFFFSMTIIFLALAAQFNNFRDPLIILVSVPASIIGALVAIMMNPSSASINIYSQVGLVTLVGLISKHGILIVEFAHILQEEGQSKIDSIVNAAKIRLRPILMTSAAMIVGVIPLLFAGGAGAAARYNMGLVIASGLFIGTFLTLFLLPAVFLIFSRERN